MLSEMRQLYDFSCGIEETEQMNEGGKREKGKPRTVT